MGYLSCLHTPGILSRLPAHSGSNDRAQRGKIEEFYREKIRGENCGALHDLLVRDDVALLNCLKATIDLLTDVDVVLNVVQ